jgi:hypothetical protein
MVAILRLKGDGPNPRPDGYLASHCLALLPAATTSATGTDNI